MKKNCFRLSNFIYHILCNQGIHSHWNKGHSCRMSNGSHLNAIFISVDANFKLLFLVLVFPNCINKSHCAQLNAKTQHQKHQGTILQAVTCLFYKLCLWIVIWKKHQNIKSSSFKNLCNITNIDPKSKEISIQGECSLPHLQLSINFKLSCRIKI